MARPALLLYCQHSLGLGHLKRSWALAAALSERFRVALVSGGASPAGLTPPPGIDVFELPALAQDGDGHVFTIDSNRSVGDVRIERQRLLIETYRSVRPEVVVIELFPFGRRKFRDELIPLLEETRRGPRPIVATSVRDLLVDRGADQQKHDDRAGDLVHAYFDLVLVHTDPRFATLSETFRPSRALTTPVHHTGFVVPERGANEAPADRSGILVSGGGGRFADRLYAMSVDAHACLGPGAPPMTIVAGPLCPEQSFGRLCDAARRHPGIRVEHTVDDLCGAMRRAAVSISQCGYNTALDIVRAAVPALVVPFEENGDSEQTVRAHRLADLGVVRVIHASDGAGALADAIDGLRGFRPAATSLDLNGGERSTDILMGALRLRTSRIATMPAGAL
jgi:predicted glycosyltransferase